MKDIRKIVIEGDCLRYSSLSQINWKLGYLLAAGGYEVAHHQTSPEAEMTDEDMRLYRPALTDDPDDADLVISHKFPPAISNSYRRSILFLPWEYSGYFGEWVRELERSDFDQIWVYSEYLKQVFSQYVDQARIKVIPPGFDPELFKPEGAAYRFNTDKSFIFLFIGGSLPRKGIDVLLEAYSEAFTDRDDVALVVKDFFYGDNSGEIERFRCLDHAPEILYHYESVTQETIAAMYRAADCLVHPFRAEGFGMPILEAMASKLPVIATGYGPVLDFADSGTAYLLRYQVEPVGDPLLNRLCTHPPLWANPDKEQLKEYMHQVYASRDTAKAKAEAAFRRVRNAFSWKHTAERMEAVLEEIRQAGDGCPEVSGQLLLQPGEDIHPLQQNKAAHLLERNRPYNYTVQVLQKETGYHYRAERETRIQGLPDWPVKDTDIRLFAAADNAQEPPRPGNDLERRLSALVRYIEAGEFREAGSCMHSILGLYPLHGYLLYYFDSIIRMKQQHHDHAAQAMQAYLNNAHGDPAEFRKHWAARFLIQYHEARGQWEPVFGVLWQWHKLCPHDYRVVEELLRLGREHPEMEINGAWIAESPYWTSSQKAEYKKALLHV